MYLFANNTPCFALGSQYIFIPEMQKLAARFDKIFQ